MKRFLFVVCVLTGLLAPRAASAQTQAESPAAPAAPPAAEPEAAARAPWSARVVELFATLPVQEGGRIKPLDTYAQFRLLRFNAKRSFTTEAGEKLTPTSWLLDCLFFPERARSYRTFLVRDQAVLEAVGLRVPGRQKSDRYSYDELLPAKDKLFEQAKRIHPIEEKQRTSLDSQIYTLFTNLRDFEDLTLALTFARVDLPTHESPLLSKRFGSEPTLGLTHFLAGVPAMRAEFEKELEALPEDQREVEQSTLEDVSRAFSDSVTASSALALFPPSASADLEWMHVDHAVSAAVDGQGTEVLGLLGEWEALERDKHDPAAFEKSLATLHAHVAGLAERRGEYAKVPLEVTFYRGDYFTRALVAYLAAFLLLAASWLAPRARWLPKGVWALSGLGTLLVVVGVVLRCIIRDRPPVSTLYETILFITGVCGITLLVIEWMQRGRIALSLAPVMGAAGMFLAMKYELKEAWLSGDTMPSLVAVLDTNFWLATHVTTITMGYSAGLLAAALANVYLIGKMVGLKRGDKDFYRSLSRMIYGVVCFGLLLSVVGTILGGIWANYSWGRFWGWDPKENGALLICLGELFILHARMGGYVREHGLAALAALNGLCVAFSWWHVNNLGVGLHSYGKTEGVLLALFTYYGLGIAVVVGSWIWKLGQKPAEAPAQSKGSPKPVTT
jgi:ABC-type transport system involved in cytochrome c biogenesis permease subunit